MRNHWIYESRSQTMLQVTEVYNFDQDDLMTEDIFILDCHADTYVWVGQQVDTKNKLNALSIADVSCYSIIMKFGSFFSLYWKPLILYYFLQKFVERDFLHETLSLQAPVYIVMEGGEPPFFTRFFSWDSSKSAVCYPALCRHLSSNLLFALHSLNLYGYRCTVILSRESLESLRTEALRCWM